MCKNKAKNVRRDKILGRKGIVQKDDAVVGGNNVEKEQNLRTQKVIYISKISFLITLTRKK
jgi:hypothetical protein